MLRTRHQLKRFLGFYILTLVSIFILLIFNQLALAIPNGGYMRPELLIQPEDLKSLIDRKDPDIRIIDVREKIKYLAGHVPGAVNIWRPDIVHKDHPVPGMMAPQAQIEEVMGRLGVSHQNTLIIYSDSSDGARLWWILAYYGFPISQMKLLDGGPDGWKVKGYPTEIIPPQVSPAQFRLPGRTKSTESLLCTLPEVKGALKEPNKIVLDVRAPKEYTGEEILRDAVRAGRIPGVAWIEWREVLVKEGPHKGYWKSAEEIRKLFADIGVTPDKEIYIYCQSGVRSAHSLVSLYLIGFPLERLRNYDGSWIEWSRSTEAIETGPLKK
ncbi:MAG: sulfurtransferase [Deltaproteobacteria bacterium]|nr:sulfurtransferase [Deltaproteobacteria bacterium]MBM4322505.1 sulfurtransferase [Deltaproteobacteria bacterium]